MLLTLLPKKILPIVSISLCIASCSKDNSPATATNDNINYSITYNPTEVVAGKNIHFSPGDSANPTYQYTWDFGDKDTSHEIRPYHIYKDKGYYVVTLEIIQAKNREITKQATINVADNDRTDGKPSLREGLAGMKDSIWVCAHRGYHDDRPGNSLTSIQGSIDRGIEMDEIDIRTTKDGILILSHDATIDAATNGSGKVSDLTLEEIQSYKLMFDDKLTDQVIPRLSDVLQLAKGKVYLDLDIKIDDYTKVYELVKQYGMLYQVTFTIYGPDKADELIALDDKLVLMPVIHSEDEYNTYTGAGLNMALAQFNSSMYTGSVGSKFIDEAHSLGISFFANCYVNDTRTPKGTDFNQIDRFIRLNGQIIQTDYPVDVKQYLKTKGLN